MLLPRSSAFCLVLIVFGCILTGCQYRFGYGSLSDRYSTISVPYAEGDARGGLTTEVIRKLSSTGAFRYVTSCGDLQLKIKMLELNEENIGFRYDRKRDGRLKKNIIPTESRLEVAAIVTLIDTGTGKVVGGPVRIVANTEFDHTYYATRDQINVFSLGQLSDIDAARDAAMIPLNRTLAEHIVDYVVNSW